MTSLHNQCRWPSASQPDVATPGQQSLCVILTVLLSVGYAPDTRLVPGMQMCTTQLHVESLAEQVRGQQRDGLQPWGPHCEHADSGLAAEGTAWPCPRDQQEPRASQEPRLVGRCCRGSGVPGLMLRHSGNTQAVGSALARPGNLKRVPPSSLPPFLSAPSLTSS